MRIRTDDISWEPHDAIEALDALERSAERLRAVCDPRAVFLDIYRIVTERLVTLLKAPDAGGFLEPGWVGVLAGRFAEHALRATLASLRDEPQPCPAWRFATYYAAAGIAPPGDGAILALNAHMNHDLALVVYEVIASERPSVDARRLRRYESDFFAIDDILKHAIPLSLDLLVHRYRCATTQTILRIPFSRPVLCGVVLFTMKTWRARVWGEVMALLSSDADARRALVERITVRAGRIAQIACASSALQHLLTRGHLAPFSLAQPAAAWPPSAPQATRSSAHTDASPMIVCCGFTPIVVGMADASTT